MNLNIVRKAAFLRLRSTSGVGEMCCMLLKTQRFIVGKNSFCGWILGRVWREKGASFEPVS